MASVQNIAVLVRYFMSTDVTIPPTISVRAHSIPPTIGGDRNDFEPSRSRNAHQTLLARIPAHAGPVSLSAARQTLHFLASPSDESALAPHTNPIASPANLPRLRSIRLTWGRLGQADWIQRRICKTPAVVPHPRSEPASVIWSFPHQIKLTFGRRVMRPHHNPACGGQGSRGRDHS